MKRRRKTLVAGILLILLGLGIGYAFLTTNLSINGIADVDSNTWDIYWDNVQVMNGSVEAELPEIDTDKTSVSFGVHLSKPGDFYEFTVDAKNDGSIDAMIDVVTKSPVNRIAVLPEYLNYTVTYDDGIEVAENQLLKANSKETYKIRVEYRTDINPKDLPDTADSFSLTFGVSYVQADSSAQKVREVVYYGYSESHTRALYEEAFEEDGRFQTAEEAKANVFTYLGTDKMYLKVVIADGKYADAYVVFTVPEEMEQAHPKIHAGTYILRGGGATKVESNYYSPDSIYYEDNKNILLTAFDESVCYENPSADIFDCTVSGAFWVQIEKSGSVWVTDSSVSGLRSCVVNEWGSTPGRQIIVCGNYDD